VAQEHEGYRVHVVVDPHYGERLRALPAGEPVWVVGSPDNRPVIEALWRKREGSSHRNGITSFSYDPNGTPEAWLIGELPAIDLHHGEYSHNPPYSVLNVIGVVWSEPIGEKLGQLGFAEHSLTAEGFVARRTRAT
jgi:hypothetical protein